MADDLSGLVNNVVTEARQQAFRRAREYHSEHGGSTDPQNHVYIETVSAPGQKLFKALTANGFRQYNSTAVRMRNPAGLWNVSDEALSAGAEAAQKVLLDQLGLRTSIGREPKG